MKNIIFSLMLIILGTFGVLLEVNADTQSAYLTAAEPIENTDGTPLADLKTLRVYYYLQGTDPTKAQKKDFPASASTGGGAFAESIAFEIPVGKPLTYMFFMKAVAIDGRESVASTIGQKTFINDARPNGMTNFVVGDSLKPQ